MADRFERLFELPSNLYSAGSPVIINAGALLKDNQTGNIIVQLKYQSVSTAPIKAVRVDIDAFDIAGNEIQGVKNYQYLDMNILNGQTFGNNKAIVMSDVTTRSFAIAGLGVVLSDGTVLDVILPLSELPKAISLQQKFCNAELVKQYCLATNSQAHQIPCKTLDLWKCSCGEWNSHHICTKCCASKITVFNAYNLDDLAIAMKDRLDAEEIERKEQADRNAVKEKQRKAQNKKLAKVISIVAVIAAIVALFSFWFYPDVIMPYIAYGEAVELLSNKQYDAAATVFERLGTYKDSEQKLHEINEHILSEKYDNAMKLYESKQYHQAIAAFEDLNDYNDSRLMINGIYETMYTEAEVLLKSGKYETAAQMFAATGDYRDGLSRCWQIRTEHCYYGKLSAGGRHTVYLNSNGKADAIGHWVHNQLHVKEWDNLKSIHTGNDQTFGITQDGKVYGVGNNSTGQCAVSTWDNIVMIDGGFTHTVGLKANGKVRATGEHKDGQCDVDAWTEIVAIACDGSHTVGLQANGTVVATGSNKYNQCDVETWTDIVAIDCSSTHTVGLKADGTVVATGDNEFGQCDVSDWSDIVAVAAGWQFTIGLKENGEVVSTGWNEFGQCNVESWENVVSISCGNYHTVALKEDGTILAIGKNDDEQCNVEVFN